MRQSVYTPYRPGTNDWCTSSKIEYVAEKQIVKIEQNQIPLLNKNKIERYEKTPSIKYTKKWQNFLNIGW